MAENILENLLNNELGLGEAVEPQAHENIDSIIEEEEYSSILSELIGQTDETDLSILAGRVSNPLEQLQSNQWKVSKAYNPIAKKFVKSPYTQHSGVPEWTKQSRESLDRIKHMKNLEALKHSPSRQANLANLNMKKLPGGIDIGTAIRPAFGGALTAAITLAPLLQELIYKAMGLDPSGLENQPPEFPHLDVGESVETKLFPPPRIEPILPKDINIR